MLLTHLSLFLTPFYSWEPEGGSERSSHTVTLDELWSQETLEQRTGRVWTERRNLLSQST